MLGCKGLSVWTIRWILFFSEILEQTQLVERELVRTLQSLADVRLILLSEVRRTQGLSFTTYRPSFDQYTSRTTAYEKSYRYSSLLFVLRSFWSSKVLLINWACPNLYHFRGCIDLRPFIWFTFYFQDADPTNSTYSLNMDFSSKRTKLKITAAVQRETPQVYTVTYSYCYPVHSKLFLWSLTKINISNRLSTMVELRTTYSRDKRSYQMKNFIHL